MRLSVSRTFLSSAAFLGAILGVAGVPSMAGASDDFPEPCGFVFREVATERGIDFVHRTGAAGSKHLPETMGAGVAVLDFDGDGWLDLYFVQSGPFPPQGVDRGDRLYRNLGAGRFAPVAAGTAGQTFELTSYGQGVVAGDLDGDGDHDLVLTAFGGDDVLLNRGDGGFEHHPLSRPLSRADPQSEQNRNPGWSASAALADLDGDLDLDLYVTGYLDYGLDHGLFCGELGNAGAEDTEAAGSGAADTREYCDPSLFDGAADVFYRNEGKGTFTDATMSAGLGSARGKGLGVVLVDLDGDRQPEIYVANDITPNHLFRNLGDGRFEDVSLLSGAAVNRQGKPEAGMGIAAADFDGDGDVDLAVTHFDVETNTLYRNQGELFFDDVSARSGFGLPSFNLLGFGIVEGDFDLDGDLDVYVANGHIFEQPKRDNVSHAQPDLWLASDGRGVFSSIDCSGLGIPTAVGRGAATGDLDQDGDLDLVVTNSNAAPFVLDNQALSIDSTGASSPAADSLGNDWLGIELIGAAPNTDAVGAEVILRSGDRAQHRRVLAGSSYLSSSDRRLLFSLPVASGASLEVIWPTGDRLRLEVPASNRYLRIQEPSRQGSDR